MIWNAVIFGPGSSSPLPPSHPLTPPRCSRDSLRRRDLPTRPHIRRIVPQQTSDGQVLVEDVPSQRLRKRGTVPRYPPESLESYVRRSGHFDFHSESLARSESEQVGPRSSLREWSSPDATNVQSSKRRGSAVVQGEHEGVRQARAGNGHCELRGLRKETSAREESKGWRQVGGSFSSVFVGTVLAFQRLIQRPMSLVPLWRFIVVQFFALFTTDEHGII